MSPQDLGWLRSKAEYQGLWEEIEPQEHTTELSLEESLIDSQVEVVV